MKVFWDTNLFVYLIEQHPIFHPQVHELYRSHKSRGETVITSTLTYGELIAQPIRRNRMDIVARYGEIFGAGGIEMTEFSTRAAEIYGEIRARTALKQPDAIQFSCAIAGGASRFFTNDRQLWGVRVPGIDSVQGPGADHPTS